MHPLMLPILILPLTTLALPSIPPQAKAETFKLISLQTYKDSTCNSPASEDIEDFGTLSSCKISPEVFTNFMLHERDLTAVEIKEAKIVDYVCTYKFFENDKCDGKPIFSKTEDEVETLKCIGLGDGKKARSWDLFCAKGKTKEVVFGS